jgi:hypothetical protein
MNVSRTLFTLLVTLCVIPLSAQTRTVSVAWDASPDAPLEYRLYVNNTYQGATSGLTYDLWSVPEGSVLLIGVSSYGYVDLDGDGMKETLREGSLRTEITYTVPVTYVPPPPPPPPAPTPTLSCKWYLTGDIYLPGAYSPEVQVKTSNLSLWLSQRKAEGWVFHQSSPKNRTQVLVTLQCVGI